MNESARDDLILRRLTEIERRLGSLRERVERLEQARRGLEPGRTQEEGPPVSRAAAPRAGEQAEAPRVEEAPPKRVIPPTRPSYTRPPSDATIAPRAAAVRTTSPARRPVEAGRSATGLDLLAVDWRELLRKLNLLPPGGETDLEIHVGTWWATRIGVLLAVLCGVFFGVWVSQYTTPWIKFLELLTGSLAASLLGLWLERRYEQFGRVVFAGGLALLFFSCYAAYAVPAVKVVESPTLATVLQFVAVGVIVAASLWRDSRLIGTMAVFLGYVACLFSFWVGLDRASLAAALVLGCGASALYLRRRWAEPMQLAVPLTYAIYAGVFIVVWHARQAPPGFAVALGYPLAYLAVFWAADYAALVRNTLMGARGRRLVQLCNTSAAVVLGFAAVNYLFHDRLSTFYFAFAAAMLAGCGMYYLVRRWDFLMQTYLLKGTTLLSLGIITEYGARTRWVTLAIQSFLLLLSARRTRLWIAELAMSLVWLASLGYFLHYTYRIAQGGIPLDLWTTNGTMSVAYLLFSCLLLSLQGRWLAGEPRPEGAAGSGSGALAAEASFRNQVNAVYGILIAGAGVAIASAYFGPGFFPTNTVLLAAMVALCGWACRQWIPHVGAGLMLVYAHVRLWGYPVPGESMARLWVNAVVLVAPTIAAAWILLRETGGAEVPAKRGLKAADGFLHTLWIVALQVACYKTLSAENYLLVTVIVSLVISVVADLYPFRVLRDLAALPTALALASLGWARMVPQATRLPEAGNEISLWLATVTAFGLACRYVAPEGGDEGFGIFQRRGLYAWIVGLLAALVGWYTLAKVFEAETFMLAAGVAAAAVALLGRWPGLRPALVVGGLYLALAQAMFYVLVLINTVAGNADSWAGPPYLSGFAGHSEGGRFVWRSLAVAGLTIGYPLLVGRLRPELSRLTRRGAEALFGIWSLVLLFVLFLSREGTLAHYVTVFWGLSSIGVFLVGLSARSRPLRLIGLAGLAVCIPRVFTVDIRSTLYRIYAFGVLGGVLLGIGFLYNKYRSAIQRLDEGG